VIVAVIEGWTLQWYGNDPFEENVKRNDSPGRSVIESNAAVSEDTV
jgi:hypothetical protein